MKKLITLLMALMMVFSLTTVAFAVKTETNGVDVANGTITITGANSEYTYSAYKLLHLNTYDNANGAYTYIVEEKWVDFFKTAEAQAYISFDEQGYASWIGTDIAAFAKLALAYAEEHEIDPEATSKDESFTFSGTGGTFSGLTLGYYLVDTSMGALCGLNTTKPDAHISVKNGIPTLDKSVEEDSHVGTGTNPWGSTNTADIGQEVRFDVTIDAQAGAESYIYHDDMDTGLELLPASIVIKHHNPSLGATEDKTLVLDKDYTVIHNPAECSIETNHSDWNCTFEIVFDQTFLNTVVANDKIYINYTAVVTDKAVIGEPGNKNGAVLTYGDNHKTEFDETTTYTYGFEIYKTDADIKPLVGAEFILLDFDKNPIDVYYNTVTGEYRVGTRVLENEEKCEIITVANANGLARVKGLDNGTYYLRETKAPDGFKLLTEDKQFIISGSNLYAEQGENGITIGASVHVENNKGVTLPETGAMGTTMFIAFGMMLVLCTGVLLVTKKRMTMIED